MKKDSGLTFVEMLVSLAITSFIFVLAFSILHSALNVKEETERKAFLRSQTQIIVKELDNILFNTDEIFIEDEMDEKGHFNKFTALDIRYVQEESGAYKTIEHSKTTIEVRNKKLFINGRQIQDEPYSVNETPFSLENGQLLLHLIVSDGKNTKPYEVQKRYRIGEKE